MTDSPVIDVTPPQKGFYALVVQAKPRGLTYASATKRVWPQLFDTGEDALSHSSRVFAAVRSQFGDEFMDRNKVSATVEWVPAPHPRLTNQIRTPSLPVFKSRRQHGRPAQVLLSG